MSGGLKVVWHRRSYNGFAGVGEKWFEKQVRKVVSGLEIGGQELKRGGPKVPLRNFWEEV